MARRSSPGPGGDPARPFRPATRRVLARYLPVSCAVVGILAVAASARAYVRSEVPGSEGTCLSWSKRELAWVAARGDAPGLALSRALPVLEASFETWASVSCTDLVFLPRGESESREVGYGRKGKNENLLLFRTQLCADVVPEDDPCWAEDGCANRWDCWNHPPSAIAVTTTTFTASTGEIVDADIEFNAAAFAFTTDDGGACETDDGTACIATDLQNTATHEIGHFLGLAHSPEREATMFASAPPGEVQKRTLSDDDIAGLCAVYPAGLPAAACSDQPALEEPVGCSCGFGTGARLEGIGLVVLVVFWLAGRRRRPGEPRRGAAALRL